MNVDTLFIVHEAFRSYLKCGVSQCVDSGGIYV